MLWLEKLNLYHVCILRDVPNDIDYSLVDVSPIYQTPAKPAGLISFSSKLWRQEEEKYNSFAKARKALMLC